MGRNNFGWRSREAPRAVTFALKEAASRGQVSYSTAATISERFAVAWQSLRESGSRWLEDVSREQLQAYGHFSKPPSPLQPVSRHDGAHEHIAHQALVLLALSARR